MSNSLLHIAGHPSPVWCGFSKQKVFYILLYIVHYSERGFSSAQQNFRRLFLQSFHFHFCHIGRYGEAQLPERGECELLLLTT